MLERPFVLEAVGKLNAVVGQNRVNVLRHNRNQLPQKTASYVTDLIRMQFGVSEL